MATTIPSLWRVNNRDEEAESALREALGVGGLVATVLAQRGFGPAEAEKFLHAGIDQLHSPKLLPDYEKARDEILGAMERKERIYIHGDYDVDGVTSAAILTRCLRNMGADVHVHVPHRVKEGYGIHPMAVQEAKDVGASLFLTCDCGIVAHDQIRQATELGLRVVVTDHHEPGTTLPSAQAIVNPHRADSRYPFADLCGAGVALKLCAGLAEEKGIAPQNFYRAFLDLAAVGTVADVMPLVGENRIIVRHGLPLLQATKKVGLQSLIRLAVKEGTSSLKAWHIGFNLAPRLNAAGRLDDAARSLQLLLTTDGSEAQEIAEGLDTLNRERQDEQKRMIEEAIGVVIERGLESDPVLVVHQSGWHHGIIGLAAGKLVERFRRPAFVIGIDPESGVGKGSARSIPGFHLANALHSMPDLVKGGGHELAAGFSVDLDKVGAFRDALIRHAATLKDFQPGHVPIDITAEVRAEEVTLDSVQEMEILEPFGMGNPSPLFLTRKLRVEEKRVMGKEGTHVSLILRSLAGSQRQITAWNMADSLGGVHVGQFIDVVYNPEQDTYQGNTKLKWNLRDWVHSA